jgi:hypothetical protein
MFVMAAANFIGGMITRASIREFVINATAVGCVVAVGAVITVIAGTILFIPINRKKIADRAARAEQRVAEAAKFETLYWDEYDAMMVLKTPIRAATANPVTERSPQGDAVTMVYLPDRVAFGYYTNRKNGTSYPQLETVARKYLVDNAQRDVAKCAYADRRQSNTAAMHDNDIVDLGNPGNTGNTGNPGDLGVVESKSATDSSAPTTSGGIFAMFRRYNRKPAAASGSSGSTGAPLEYTRFVYLGSMHDYDYTASSSSASDSTASDYDAIDYAEFKRLKMAKIENGQK